MDDSSGKTLQNLVSNDRLKRYNVNREKFNEKLPRINVTERVDANQRKNGEAKPLDIVREHKNENRCQYIVKYDDGKTYLCDWVNKTLRERYKHRLDKQMKQARLQRK